MLEQIPEIPVPIAKNVIKDLGNMVPKPIKEPCKAALDAADKTFSNTKTTRPEVSLQYIA